MSYYTAKTIPAPFDVVVVDVAAKLEKNGFGVLTDIDVQATLKSKMGVDVPRYRILGACNPRFAHEALTIEERLGVLLPCEVIVRETQDQRGEVASIDPASAMERTGNPALGTTAEEVRLCASGARHHEGPHEIGFEGADVHRLLGECELRGGSLPSLTRDASTL